MTWAGDVARMGWRQEEEEENRHVHKPQGKRPLRRPRYMCVDNIKIYLRVLGWGGMDWSDMAQDKDQWRDLVNMILNLLIS